MWIKITPIDPLFFRSGRPFSMGSETWAEGVFPPHPSTIYGALRTFLIFQRGTLKDFKEKGYEDIGSPCKRGTIEIKGPFLYNSSNKIVYFPVPFDCVEKKEKVRDEENKVLLLNKIKRSQIFYSDVILEEILVYKDKEQVDQVYGYFDDITFKEYLDGQKTGFFYRCSESFFKLELKIGIARDKKTLTSRDSHLYRVPMVRLKSEYSFLIKIEKLLLENDIPDKGIFQLGAEGKTVSFEKIDSDPMEEINKMEVEVRDKIFKLYLATPAIFKKGWLPEWIDENTLEGTKNGIKVKLVTCAIGKYIRIGGWDMAKGKPKPMYKAVPAGSVYYFKVLNNVTSTDVRVSFHFKNISDINPEEGFGLSFIGGNDEKDHNNGGNINLRKLF